MSTSFPQATISGYPRIGKRRELKRALESLWAGTISEDDYATATRALRVDQYAQLAGLGLSEPYAIPADFSAYDHVLDTALITGIIAGDPTDLDTYFAYARGTDTRPPLEMTKWFDTNYHYLVPEVADSHSFRAQPQVLLDRFAEAAAAGHTVRPVLVGPVTLLALSKAAGTGAGTAAGADSSADPLDRLTELTHVYTDILTALAGAGVEWVQLDEPILTTDLAAHPDADLATLAASTYGTLTAHQDRPALFVNTPYGSLDAALDSLTTGLITGTSSATTTHIDALGVDVSPATLALDPDYLTRLTQANLGETVLVAGVIDGRNVWAADLAQARDTLTTLEGGGTRVVASTSVPLLHVPYTVTQETALPVDVAGWLSFAQEKVAEVVALSSGHSPAFDRAARAKRTRAESARVHNSEVAARVETLGADRARTASVEERREAQREYGISQLPTTTIGSFPQTADIRKARAAHRVGKLGDTDYVARMQAEITRVIEFQERLGLDILVHGEPERNDMVQYFAEHLDGFAVTDHGWVQSYGSRCTRPPILFGDVSRPAPITVPWSTFAAGLTDKPVKGMLTGPVTILAWSFVRDDQPIAVTATQLALALQDEVQDLEAAGIHIIQVDEPALRELLPLRERDREAYLEWAVGAFRLVSAGVKPSTQIHTHLCYSEFSLVLDAIRALDADVTSIEAARSRMELLDALDGVDFRASLGPGVYDIHSPRVPSVAELVDLINAARAHVTDDRLWVNPDCGLKTRGYAEVEASLTNLVAARNQVVAQG